MRTTIRILIPLLGLLAAGGVAVTAGVIGAYFYVFPGLPPAETIRDIPLQVPLRIFSRDGRLISEIGEQRRMPVVYDDIPKVVVNALLAAEDDRFFQHPGVDYQGILRAGWKYLTTGSRRQGGSTITQQLARDYFLNRERRFTRKLREMFLAYRIEKEFSKQDILAMFLNKMFYGQRAYGIAAAARVYFNKNLAELNAAEAATLAGVLQAPSNFNPVSNPDKASSVRSYVLRRMREVGYLDETQYTEAMSYPMESELHGPDVELDAPYVAEMVRREVLKRYGEEIYYAGYEVFTTIDSRLQGAAVDAVRNGLLEYDRRHGYRGPLAKLGNAALAPREPAGTAVQSPPELSAEARQVLRDHVEYGGLRVGIVTGIDDDQNVAVILRRNESVELPWSGISWAREYIDEDTLGPELTAASEVLEVGDVIYVIPTVDGLWALAQLPQVESAFVALDPDDGAVSALQGGFDYSRSKFNRAIQIRRQPGSAFKPFIYSAALENGFTAATVVNDDPIVMRSNELETDWRPTNYGGRFHGPTRLRKALYRSYNLVSVRVLIKMGLPPVLAHLKNFGFSGKAAPNDTSIALGSGAVSPLALASGYTVFANGGYRVEPYFIDTIYNAAGEELYHADPTIVCESCAPPPGGARRAAASGVEYASADALIDKADRYRPDASQEPDFFSAVKVAPRVVEERNVYIVSDMMRDVIMRGTGRRASRRLGRKDLSGKTGTSNDRRDAWFAGFNADIVATTWVGFNEDKPLGNSEEGSKTALPIWIYFMEEALRGQPQHTQPQPAGMTTVRISADTGELAGPRESNFIFETFRNEFVPQRQTDNGLDFDPFNSDTPSTEDPENPAEDDPLF